MIKEVKSLAEHGFKEIVLTGIHLSSYGKDLVGENLDLLAEHLDSIKKGSWKKGQLPERWDGRTAERIVKTLLEEGIA